MKFTQLAAAAALALVAVPGAALAQDAAVEVTAGTTIYGVDGNEIGKIDRVVDGTAVLVVNGMEVPVTQTSFGKNDSGVALNTTKAQVVSMLEAKRQQEVAARDAALIVGTEVSTKKGMLLGPITQIDGDNIEVAYGDGSVVFTRAYFTVDDGKLVALVSLDEIKAAQAANGTAGGTAEGGQ